MTDARVTQLVKALAADPWVDNAVRKICFGLAKQWDAEDKKKSEQQSASESASNEARR